VKRLKNSDFPLKNHVLAFGGQVQHSRCRAVANIQNGCIRFVGFASAKVG
jgi:hypothetical protein